MRIDLVLILSGLVAWPTAAGWSQGPTYDSPQTKQLVEQMVAAHGGMARWQAAPSFRYTAIMNLSILPVGKGRTYHDNWRYYTVTLDPRDHRGYVDIPFEQSPTQRVGYDGTELWTIPPTFDPSFQDSPTMLLYFHYAMVTLPWQTQRDGVHLAYVGTDTLPGYPAAHQMVDMTFDPAPGRMIAGHYRLYIDPSTHLLRGWAMNTRYAILPGAVIPDSIPVSRNEGYRIVDAYSTVDGIVLPRSYVSWVQPREGQVGLQVAGPHLVINPSLQTPLDPARLKRPPNAQVIWSRAGSN